MERNTVIKEINHLNLKLYKALIGRYKKLGIGLTPVHSRVIMYIYNSKVSVCQKDIEEFISCNKSTLSNILDTMEKNELIYRVNSDVDSRIKIIKLSDKSLSIADSLSKDRDKIDSLLCSNISDEDINTFFKVLGMIEGNIVKINE